MNARKIRPQRSAIARPALLLTLGALAVAGVTPDSPAARAGVQPGDLLVSIEQRPIRGVGDLFAGLPRSAIGTPQQLRLLRHNEILKTVVTPVNAPKQAA